MSQKVRIFLAILVILITGFGWFSTLNGVGSFSPLKDQINLGLDIEGGAYVLFEADTNVSGEELKTLMDQTQAVLENRAVQMGFSDPVVTIEGDKRIRVELPGAADAEAAIEEIGQVAQLKFILSDGTTMLDGSSVKDASFTQDSNGTGYVVTLDFKQSGAAKFEKATEVALAGTTPETYPEMLTNQLGVVLDDTLISHPNVHEVISGGSCEISGGTGGFSQEEASHLAALIRGGSLPVDLTEITSSTQSATIGYNALDKSVVAGVVGFMLIIVLMLVAYRFLGLAADLALSLYMLLVLWGLVVSHTTLTLPGIAGIILGIGMGVDANVIIFSRIREEISNGKTIRVAVSEGFRQALSAIFDGQITTLIAAVVLYEIGTATVKSFAISLMISVVASILCAVVVTQLYITVLSNSEKMCRPGFFGIRKNGQATFTLKRQFSFMKHRKLYYIVSITVIVIGILFASFKGFNFGIDFTGGTMMQIDMGKQVATEEVKGFMKDEITKVTGVDNPVVDIIYAGKDNSEVIIRTTTFMNNDDREVVIKDVTSQFSLGDDAVLASEQFGAAVGKELKQNALKAILIAALGMLIYVAFRFKSKNFGIASIAGVMHDALWVISFYAIFGVTINNPFIAGILTVVGYSINDTIVIFDRIRENLAYTRKKELPVLIDTSVNQTLGRSIMTSATTFLVMIPLFIMVSTSIREFVLPLMIGVAVGALSSIFVCSPIYYDLTRLSEKKKYKGAKKNKYPGKPAAPKEKKDEEFHRYNDGSVV